MDFPGRKITKEIKNELLEQTLRYLTLVKSSSISTGLDPVEENLMNNEPLLYEFLQTAINSPLESGETWKDRVRVTALTVYDLTRRAYQERSVK